MRIRFSRLSTALTYVLLAGLPAVVVGAQGVMPAVASAGEACPNEQVRRESNVNPSTGEPYDMGLPQCRAYEMVSPVFKGGHDVGVPNPIQGPAAAAGGAVIFDSAGDFEEPTGGAGVFLSISYLGSRGETGWSSVNDFLPASIAPRALSTTNETGWMFSPDLSREAVCGEAGEGSAVTEAAIVCAIHEPNGSWVASPRISTEFAGVSTNATAIYGGSNDFSHIFLGTQEVAGLGTGGPVTERDVAVDNNDVPIPGAVLGNSPGGFRGGTTLHAVSEDGETVYFEAGALYARVGAAHTVNISEPSVADCSECQTAAPLQRNAIFQGASADGSKVFFTTEQELLPGKKTNTLYEYDWKAPEGHRIAAISGIAAKAEVQGGVVDSSGDGSRIVFVARGVLTTAPNAANQEAELGADNMYVYERDSVFPAGHMTFVAMLCSGQETSGSVADSQCPGANADDSELWSESYESLTHQVHLTRNGEYMDFSTAAHLSPEDTNEAAAVYRYDTSTGEMTWVSRPAPGFSGHVNEATASAILGARTQVSGAIPDVEDISRSISENGEDIVFVTQEKLQADDSAFPGTFGVYLWHDGSVSLVSDGQSPIGAEPETIMSGSGSDIYIMTPTPLVGQDIDENVDMYDVRVDGGYPAPVSPPECGREQDGEACQGPLTPAPLFAAPPSSTFTGGANLTPPAAGGKATPAKPKSAQLTRVQKLAAALRVCRKQPLGQGAHRRQARERRASCEAKAHKRYRAPAKAKSKRAPKTTQGNRRSK
jgi:hypothetical protein